MGARNNLPVEFVPTNSRLRFLRQTSFAEGNHKRRKNGERQVRAKAEYECRCGKVIETQIDSVKSGRTKSCGCLLKDEPNGTKHGLYYHPLYKILRGMIQRCENKNSEVYRLYGGAGVTVCDEWRNNPESFINWAINNGWQEGMHIDKDLKGGKIYSPENCSIVTPLINANNRVNNRVLYFNGVNKTIAEWARETGLGEDCIGMRIKHGWPVEKALTEPLREKQRHEYNGESKTLSEWSRELGISKATITTRLNRGWSLQKALSEPINKR